MGNIDALLNQAEGNKYFHQKTYRHQPATRDVKGPYYHFARLDQRTEITVTSHGIALDDDTELEVHVERMKDGDWGSLRVDIPSMNIIECVNITELEFMEFMRTIGANQVELEEVVERSQANAKTV